MAMRFIILKDYFVQEKTLLYLIEKTLFGSGQNQKKQRKKNNYRPCME